MILACLLANAVILKGFGERIVTHCDRMLSVFSLLCIEKMLE